MEDIFAPREAEFCNFREALEFLAFGWIPVDDEKLLDAPRRRFFDFFPFTLITTM